MIDALDEKDKKIFKLESELSTNKIMYELLKDQIKNMKSRREIVATAKYLIRTLDTNSKEMRLYEEGQIKSLLWVLGLPEETRIENIK